MTIDAYTQVCAVLGNPVRHSMSPLIHNAAIEATGVNFSYVAFEVENIEQAMEGMRGLGIRGMSITIPHKVTAMELVDELDPIAASIGCINTVVNNDGVLKGYNTDGTGALRAITASGVKLSGTEVTLLGTGGSARAIACTLAARGDLTRLHILGVVPEERDALTRHVAQQTSAQIIPYELTPENLAKAMENSQTLIHCTPVGMYPHVDESLVPKEMLSSTLVVFDVVYNPMETRLIREAKENRCRVIYGVEMFIYQAVEQFELFTEQPAPESVMRKVILDKMSKRSQ